MTDSESVIDNDEATVAPEETLPMSRVNDLVGMAKKKGAAKAMSEIEDLKKQIAGLQEQAGNQSMGGVKQDLDVDAIYSQLSGRLAEDMNAREAKQAEERQAQEAKQVDEQKAEEARKYEQQMQGVASDYLSKMAGGKELHDDFEEVTSKFAVADFPEIVILANQVDNTADVMYDLVKNKGKLANINAMSRQSPQTAMQMIQELSDSIKVNGKAKSEARDAPKPLSRVKSSTAGSDTGDLSISDLRKMPYLRG